MNQINTNSQVSCPNCERVISEDSRFCNHCGFNLAENQLVSNADVSANENPISGRMFLLVAVGLIALLSIAVVASYVYKKNRAASESSAQSENQSAAQTMSDRATQIEAKILRGERLEPSDIAGLNAYELRVLRNIHFARYGRQYDRPGLGDYFYTRSWYQPSDSYNDDLINATDKANINVILKQEKVLETTSTATSSTSSEVSSTPSASQSYNSSPAVSRGGLTVENVQRAVDKTLDWTRKGGKAVVLGIQELPQENAARADIRFEGFQYNTMMGQPVSRDKKTPPQPGIKDPNYYSKMAKSLLEQTQVKRFSGKGVGILKRYNDGRWVLTEVHFDFVGLGSNIEIR